MKLLIHFEKGERARWLGHLDILRTFERAIRRAELPIAFSNGFNPREKISFASALGVGTTGSSEPATIELTDPIPPSEVANRLNDKLPPGIHINGAEQIADEGSRDLLNAFVCAEIEATCDGPLDASRELLDCAARELMLRDTVIVVREREGKRKQVDVRPLIRWLRVRHAEAARVTFSLGLSLGQGGTAKPAEVIGALSELVPGLSLRRAHRVRLLTEEQTSRICTGSEL